MILDSEFIQTSHGLALALTVFRHNPFIVLGMDSEDPFIQTLNEKLAALKAPPIRATRDPREAVALVRKPGTVVQALLASSRRDGYFETLKNQLGSNVRIYNLESFIENAAGIVNRLGLQGFVYELQVQFLNQFYIRRSA